ncbi:unnamed protein product [Cuscuta campestris]|uniref:Uncharacterized protein n=1 Tax=Cuscuta campestris TaxID=132261 RepID=A0A484KVH9_9ASTE|nr:unnamed protein product [Cuscuta campestris]
MIGDHPCPRSRALAEISAILNSVRRHKDVIRLWRTSSRLAIAAQTRRNHHHNQHQDTDEVMPEQKKSCTGPIDGFPAVDPIHPHLKTALLWEEITRHFY